MSVFLITSSLVTTLLVPAADFAPGGPANRRALAYLAHCYVGSTMAGLLNLIPPYLPRATGWQRRGRAPSDPSC